MSLSQSKEYLDFLGTVQQKWITLRDGLVWQLFSTGPCSSPPVIFIPSTSTLADVFFCQLAELSQAGHRVISASYPDYYTVEEFCQGLRELLEVLEIPRFHGFGLSLGGFLLLHFANRYPTKVMSLILSNSFSSTRVFTENSVMCFPMFTVLPSVYLRGYLMSNFPTNLNDPKQRRALQFVIEHIEKMDGNNLAARLTLNCRSPDVTLVRIPHDRITLIDTIDCVSLPLELREGLYDLLPSAKYATLKKGGDFPILSNPDDVNLHIRTHLLRMDKIDGKYDNMQSPSIEVPVFREA